jgi:ubiquinone/menaquinone biosynthesis C-methylase UbiE
MATQARLPEGVMTEHDKVFAGSVPELYDRLMVPLIFEPYARDLAERLGAYAPPDLLELAAGTGVVTRAIAARLPETRIVATDLNPPMLAQAARRLPASERLTWQQADALALPFEAGGFDAVVCQFGAMFFPDKVAAYREARRMLKPGGRFLFNVWDGIETNEFADVVTQALADRFPSDPPRFMARTPHGYHDGARIRAEVTAAGFTAVTIETVAHRSRAADPRLVAVAYCQGTPLRNEIEARDPGGLEAATDAATARLAARFGAGAVDGLIRAHVITAAG